MMSEKTITNCDLPEDLFPLNHAQIQCCHRQHLLHCPTTRKVESSGRELLAAAILSFNNVDAFNEEVCSWGGQTGARILGLIRTSDPQVRLTIFRNVVQNIRNGDWIGAMDTLRNGGIKGLGQFSYSSKHLRMLDPVHCAVLDSLMEEYIELRITNNMSQFELWVCYSLFCQKKAEELTLANVLLGDYLEDCDGQVLRTDALRKDATNWTAGDVDMACFSWLQNWCYKNEDLEISSLNSEVIPPIKDTSSRTVAFDDDLVRPVVFIQENKMGSVSVKNQCSEKYNLAWVERGHLNLKLNFMAYLNTLRGEQPRIQDNPYWTLSANGKLHSGAGSGYHGYLKFDDNQEALNFLGQFVEIANCSL